MIEIRTRTRRWGNSVGIIIGNRIKANKKVRVLITEEETTKVRDIFGKIKLKTPTQELEKQIDKDLGL